MVLYGLLVFITVCVNVWLLFTVCALCGLLCDVVAVRCYTRVLCLFVVPGVCVCVFGA